MQWKITSALAVAACGLFFGTGAVFSQENVVLPSVNSADAGTTTDTAAPAMALPVDPEPQWQYVEIISVDPQKKEILVKYIDYETDDVKEMTLSVDDKTIYENVISLSEIKPLDTAGVDYIVTPEGKCLARNISIEKAQEAPAQMPMPQTPAPAETTPSTPANP
ncbi:MAG: hypothetical protein A3G38_03945 [Omnitrophica WOR_2 bacterium RIFCSPLOWO2_12_FULL_51_8]|nr:MAG: hypothetical protein A3G38_03945 [Omnitrophica WOR_2 bacterium RIFCSPLOWO2_12_FULL_51_8]